MLGADNDYLHVPASASTGEPKVLLVGDSGPAHLGPELDDVGAEADVSVAWSAQILCSAVYASDLGRKPDGTVVEREPCPVDPKPFWADIVEEYGDVKVVVDPQSAEMVRGSTLDYKDGLMGAGFSINNPNVSRTCGCGNSFS